MNFAKQIFSFMCIGSLIVFAGCAKRNSYKPQNLKSLKESVHVDYQETKEQVTVRAKAFTTLDCEYVFGDRADSIIDEKNPLQPIQLCVENNSTSPLKLHESGINLPLVSSKEITNRLGSGSKFITSGIVGGIGLCGILTGGALFILAPFSMGMVELVLFFLETGIFVTLTSPFVFLIENSGTRAVNYKISNYVHATNVGREIVINPGKTIDILIFARKAQFKPTFDFTLLNEHDQTKKQTFTVKLENQKIAE